MAPKPRRGLGGFVEHEISEHSFQSMDHYKRELIVRYGIPLEADKGRRRFKMTRQWFDQIFPGAK